MLIVEISFTGFLSMLRRPSRTTGITVADKKLRCTHIHECLAAVHFRHVISYLKDSLLEIRWASSSATTLSFPSFAIWFLRRSIHLLVECLWSREYNPILAIPHLQHDILFLSWSKKNHQIPFLDSLLTWSVIKLIVGEITITFFPLCNGESV